jgi:gliding motility-associated lipoprotein GldD
MLYSFIRCFFLLGTGAFLFSCNSDFTPKPRGFFEINLPEQGRYQPFEKAGFPYTFEYPSYAQIVQDSTFFAETQDGKYWVNVDFPQFKCKFYLSYNPVGGLSTYKVQDKLTGKYKDSSARNTFDKLLKDAFDLTSKHVSKATGKQDSVLTNPQGIRGVLFRVEGDAASPLQFFMSDTTRHFLRGSVYYDSSPNADSTQPVTDFLFRDLQHLINTLRWK